MLDWETNYAVCFTGSTVNPPSLSSLKTADEADRFGGQGRQPSTNSDIPDVAQNNQLPEINVPNPSIVHPPSLSSLKTVAEVDRFGGQGHQPSTAPPSTVNGQPSTNPDNSQSILVFNNNNKTVTGFFKKLLAKSGNEQVTADNRKRKIKISVFQFNVSK